MKLIEKQKRLTELIDEVAVITDSIETDEKNDTADNRDKMKALLAEGERLTESIKFEQQISGFKSFVTEPAGKSPLGGDGVISQPFTNEKTLGEQFVESEAYKAATQGGKVSANMRFGFDAKGFMFPAGRKATFTTTAGGLDSTVNYVQTGGMIMVEQQRLTIRDLLAVGQTTMNSIPFIKETSFTNYADMVAEEGEKPEATLATEDATAPVKKIAVLIKVTDEMFADFPMMRDYVDSRLRFMVLAKEEQQLLNGTGSGSQITGIL